jgi:hypothetical protein
LSHHSAGIAVKKDTLQTQWRRLLQLVPRSHFARHASDESHQQRVLVNKD